MDRQNEQIPSYGGPVHSGDGALQMLVLGRSLFTMTRLALITVLLSSLGFAAPASALPMAAHIRPAAACTDPGATMTVVFASWPAYKSIPMKISVSCAPQGSYILIEHRASLGVNKLGPWVKDKKISPARSVSTSIHGLAKGCYRLRPLLMSKLGKPIGYAAGPWLGVGITVGCVAL